MQKQKSSSVKTSAGQAKVKICPVKLNSYFTGIIFAILLFGFLGVSKASAICPEIYPDNMVFCEDYDSTDFSESFIERSYGTHYEVYWDECLTKAVQDLSISHTGIASFRWNPSVDLNTHCGGIGNGPAPYGNLDNNDFAEHQKRYWYFKWYQRWENSSYYSSSGKIFYLGCGGDYYCITKETGTSFHYLISDDYGVDHTILDNGYVSFSTNLDDNQWHKIEVFIDFGTANNANGDSWTEIDDVRLYNSTGLAFVTHPSPVWCLSLPGNHGNAGNAYGSQNTWIDDLQIYTADSPEELFNDSGYIDTTPPSHPTGLSVE